MSFLHGTEPISRQILIREGTARFGRFMLSNPLGKSTAESQSGGGEEGERGACRSGRHVQRERETSTYGRENNNNVMRQYSTDGCFYCKIILSYKQTDTLTLLYSIYYII